MAQSPIRMIVALGNPGKTYEKTRHNAGFLFLDALCQQQHATLQKNKHIHGFATTSKIANQQIHLIRSDRFMNCSGLVVQAAMRYFKIPASQVLLVHDELDIDPGCARLKLGGGHGGHNGLRDIIQQTATNDFVRLRLGIGPPGRNRNVANYVLDKPNLDDQKKINAAIDRSLTQIDNIVQGDVAQVMNFLHTE